MIYGEVTRESALRFAHSEPTNKAKNQGNLSEMCMEQGAICLHFSAFGSALQSHQADQPFLSIICFLPLSALFWAS